LGGGGDPNHETFLGGVQIFSGIPQYGCHMHLKIFCKGNGYSHRTSRAKKSQRYSITSTSLSGFKHRLRSVMHMSIWIAPELNIYPRGVGEFKSLLAQVLLKKKKPWYPPHISGIHLIEGDILSFGDKILLILVRLGEAILHFYSTKINKMKEYLKTDYQGEGKTDSFSVDCLYYDLQLSALWSFINTFKANLAHSPLFMLIQCKYYSYSLFSPTNNLSTISLFYFGNRTLSSVIYDIQKCTQATKISYQYARHNIWLATNKKMLDGWGL